MRRRRLKKAGRKLKDHKLPYVRRGRGYISVVVRPIEDFDPKSFRRHDIGRKGHTFRLAGKLKKTGEWATHSFQFKPDEVKFVGKGASKMLVGKNPITQRTLYKIQQRYGLI